MKKVFTAIMIALLILAMVGCAPANQNLQQPAEFYYCCTEVQFHREDGYIDSEIRDVSTLSSDLTSLFNHYLQGPKSAELISPFPAGASVQNASIEKGKLTISLNGKFSMLKDLDLSIVCICIAKTAFSFLDVETVILKADPAFKDGSLYKAISRSSFLTQDNAGGIN